MPIALAPQYTQRSSFWTAWKASRAAKSGVHQYDDDGIVYTIWFYDGVEVHLCTIWKGLVPDGVQPIYSQVQNDADKADFEAGLKLTANATLTNRTVLMEKPTSTSVTLFSHDWTDKTTWRQAAPRVVDEVATDSGNHTTYTLAHADVIDNYHGKMTGEDYLKDADGHSLRVVVKVNDVVKVEQDPHLATGGDYTVDYDQGHITFLAALDPDDVVEVNYLYATTSVFTVAPSPGKTLVVDFVEVQFSADIDLTDGVVFQPYGYVIAFAPQLAQSNGGPYPDLLKIPFGDPLIYKTMTDYQNDAVRAYPKSPALGGTGWRGATQEILVMDWDYLRAKPLLSSAGMELRIFLQHDVPFGGWYATATFYCAVVDE